MSWVAAALALLVSLSAVRAEAQVRFRRPYDEGYRLNYGFDNNGGAGGCSDYECGGACYDGHTGEDFGTPRGTRVLAAQSGRVTATFNGCANTGYVGNPCGGRCGNYVQLQHADGSRTIYCHMELGSIAVSTGANVSCGQLLGRSASSGSSSGPHLHFGYRPSATGASQEVFRGACGRGTSLWVEQRGYREPVGTQCSTCSPSAEGCNGRDDDCDGRVDEGLTRGCGSGVGECVAGTQTCSGGSWGSCQGAVGPSPERCDARDNDCDGEADEESICELEEVTLQSWAYDASTTDVDGDGRSDTCAGTEAGLACHLASGHGFEVAFPGPALPDGWAAPAHHTTLRMGDIDADGRDDACARRADGIVCWRAGRASFGEEIVGPALSDADGFAEVARFSSIRMADVDGDGRADLCARWPDGLRCYASREGAFEPVAHLPALADDAGFARVEHWGTLRMGDVDGDGRADVCARDADGLGCWRSLEGGFGPRLDGPEWSDAAGLASRAYWSTIRLADVDGDGRADACARTPAGFACHLSSGSGFGGPRLGPALADADGWNRRDHYGTIRLGDVDGDGRADVCARASDGVRCWLWTGAGFERVIPGPELSDEAGWAAPERYRTLRLADVSGDGRADLCGRTGEGVRCWRSDGQGFPIVLFGPDWTDGAGWTAAVRFASIRIGGVGRAPSEAPDAGPADPPDAAPMGDAGPRDHTIRGGCACRVGARRASPRGLFDVALVALGLAARRRRS